MRPHGTKKIFRHPGRTVEDVRADISEEFGFHLDMRTEELIGRGVGAGRPRPGAA